MKFNPFLITKFFLVILWLNISSCKDDEDSHKKPCIEEYGFHESESLIFDYSNIDSIMMIKTTFSGQVDTIKLHKAKESIDTVIGELPEGDFCKPNEYHQARMDWWYQDKNGLTRFSPEYRGRQGGNSLFDAVAVFYIEKNYFRISVGGKLGAVGNPDPRWYADSLILKNKKYHNVFFHFGVFHNHIFTNSPTGSGVNEVNNPEAECFYSIEHGPVLFITSDSSIVELKNL